MLGKKDGMNLSATIAKMRAAGMSCEAIVTALECIVLDDADQDELEPEKSPAARRQAAYRERRRLGDGQWETLRWTVLERDKHTCHYCGAEANSVDHKIPLMRGGSSELDNLVAACKRCNSSKRDGDAPKWVGTAA